MAEDFWGFSGQIALMCFEAKVLVVFLMAALQDDVIMNSSE